MHTLHMIADHSLKKMTAFTHGIQSFHNDLPFPSSVNLLVALEQEVFAHWKPEVNW